MLTTTSANPVHLAINLLVVHDRDAITAENCPWFPNILMKMIPRLAIIASLGLFLAGCITHEETVTRDVERVKVEFENDRAARIFYEALTQGPARNSRVESRTEIDIPVVFDHKRKVVSGPNSAFNEAVALCDSNKDGKITETEAKIYAENFQKK